MSRSTSDTAKAVAKVLHLKPAYKDFPQLLGEYLYPHDKVWAEVFKEMIQVELNIMEFKDE